MTRSGCCKFPQSQLHRTWVKVKTLDRAAGSGSYFNWNLIMSAEFIAMNKTALLEPRKHE